MSIERNKSEILLAWGGSLLRLASDLICTDRNLVLIDKLRDYLLEATRNPENDPRLTAYSRPPGISNAEADQAVNTASRTAIRDELARTIRSLASDDRDEYLIQRKEQAKRFGLPVGELDRLIADERGEGKLPRSNHKLQGRAPESADPEPWPEPVSGTELLDELAGALKRFAILPAYGAETIALWVMFTHAIDAADHAPRLMLTSPEKRCGKTLVLRLVSGLTPRPLLASNISPAALFRIVEQQRPTLLIDEADSFARDNESLRNIINSGHHRGAAYVWRCVGDDSEPRAFSTWCAMALSGIGRLPGTVEDRSIIVSMKRKLAGECVERFAPKEGEHLRRLAQKAARWTIDNLSRLKAHEPQIPDVLNDRAADNWRLLLSIADVAGGDWPRRARAAAFAISAEREAADVSSLGVRLLTDIRQILEAVHEPEISSTSLSECLREIEAAPWADLNRGKPLSQARLARMLGDFGVHVGKVLGGKARGYRKADFAEAFERYIPAQFKDQSVQASETAGRQGEPAFYEVSPNDNVDTSKNELNSTERTTSDTLTPLAAEAEGVRDGDAAMSPDRERYTL